MKQTLTAWALKGVPIPELIKRINQQPENLRPWIGRLIWWDRLADGPLSDPTPFKHWIDSRNDPDPDPVQLQKALVDLGYTETYAGYRSGAKQWAMGPKKRSPKAERRPLPEGIQFPVKFEGGVSLYRFSNGRKSTIYQMRVPGKSARRTGSADYYKTLALCIAESKKRSKQNENQNTKHEN